MKTTKLRVGGAVVLWDLAALSKIETIQTGLRALGLEEYSPTPPTIQACLRAALQDIFPSTKSGRTIVRFLPGQSHTVVVAREARPSSETPTVGDPWGEVILTVRLTGTMEALELLVHPFSEEVVRSIRCGIADRMQWASAAAVGSRLVQLVELSGGVTLRDRGAVYWVREDKLEPWREVVRVFEGAPTRERSGRPQGRPSGPQRNKVYCLSVTADEDMVRCVGAALEREVRGALDKLVDEVKAGQLGKKACETRESRLEYLARKIKRYEEAFQAPLPALEEATREARKSLAIAKMQASIAATGGFEAPKGVDGGGSDE